eukprot:gene22853-27620_t
MARAGAFWDELYVDGNATNMTWGSVPDDAWTHVHLQSNHSFDDDVTFMARVVAGDHIDGSTIGELKGRLAEIYLWSLQLTATQVSIIATGFDVKEEHGDLLAWYK